ncbi:seryl-tRNA synthetase [Tothia fuscella]|uniref:serine--tRNA ligase n=1 Tax=Tothia fuscella TaxID=1048955 RepID=A0A9P4P4B2_9PEZI|nr:seryl-tRNA synthetase [Tothia fuscella]
MKPLLSPLSSCASCRRRILTTFGLTLPKRPYTRPSIAPKPTLDIKHIRQAPGLYEQNCIIRNHRAQSKNPWRIKELYDQITQSRRAATELRTRRNEINELLKSAEGDAKPALLKEAKELKGKDASFVENEAKWEREAQDLAEALPNLSSTSTPVGERAEVIGEINEQHPVITERSRLAGTTSHIDIGAELDILDFTSASKTTGWGWYYLKTEAALLEQALINYSLQVAMERGWKIVSPPSMVYEHIAYACGFQPRDQNGEQQIYAIQQSKKDAGKPKLVLAGTAEIPLAAMKANQTMEESELPLKLIGVNRCYRAEAGARGINTKGLYRVHEFTKVEMFAWTLPDENSDAHNGTGAAFAEIHTPHAEVIFDEMLSIQTHILKSLGLHCRILEMPTTDLGASASRKKDIEAFFPSRSLKNEGYGEVTSASICTDYQTRRLGTRFKSKSGKIDFPCTVNGTAMAVPRVLAAILENGWDEGERRVEIPEVLRPWMGGRTFIEGKKIVKGEEVTKESIKGDEREDIQREHTLS